MAVLQQMWVIHTTSDALDAGSDGRFTIEIDSGGQRAELHFPDLPHDARQPGRTDEYEFDLRSWQFDHKDIQPGDIRITALSDDAWLPKSIWVIGRTSGGTVTDAKSEYHLLVHRPSWPRNAWLSTDPRDPNSEPARTLDQR